MNQSLTIHESIKEIDSTLTSKGQVTIPADVRRHLRVKDGDKLTFVMKETGEVTVKAARFPTVASLRGVAGTLTAPLSWDEMRQTAHDDRLQRDEGITND
jgi:AbrB family looped-hinge helix DNA binding protein